MTESEKQQRPLGSRGLNRLMERVAASSIFLHNAHRMYAAGTFCYFFFFICWILEILPSAAVCTGARPELSSRSIVVTADWNKAGTKIFLLLIVPRECYDIAGFNVQRLKKIMLSWTASFIVMARKKLNSHL